MQVQAQGIADEEGFTLLFQAANKDPVVQGPLNARAINSLIKGALS